MKKVIFNLVQSNINGGLEKVYLDYSKILSEDFEVICIASRGFVHLDELQKNGIKIKTLNITGHSDIFAAIRLLFLIKKYSPQLIIANNGRSFSILNMIRSKSRKYKTIAVNHGGNPKRLVKFDYIVAVAKHLSDKILEKFPQTPPERIITIHNGIKIDRNYIKKEEVKKKEFTIGTLSRL